MQVQGAVIREQGQTFAVVIVKPQVVRNSTEADDAIRGLMPIFGVPIVLMAQDSRGRPTYYGRQDIARFMSSVPLHAIPWREYLGQATIETRLIRSVYYRSIFGSLIGGLRLDRIQGYQQYDEFVMRRLGGAFGFIEAVEQRIEQVKIQWRALDNLYLTTAVTLLAGDIKVQQSNTDNIQKKIARIQILGESILIALLAPYYLLMDLTHLTDCEHAEWCSKPFLYAPSISQIVTACVWLICGLFAFWRARREGKMNR